MLVIGRYPLYGDRPVKDDLATMLERKGHGVWIGPNVLVRVLEIDHGMVRLAIEAPSHIRIRRDELPTLP